MSFGFVPKVSGYGTRSNPACLSSFARRIDHPLEIQIISNICKFPLPRRRETLASPFLPEAQGSYYS